MSTFRTQEFVRAWVWVCVCVIICLHPVHPWLYVRTYSTLWLFPKVEAAASLEHFLASPGVLRRWGRALARVLPSVCSVGTTRCVCVGALPLPLFNTAPVVNILTFESFKLLLATVVCLNDSFVHEIVQNTACRDVAKTFRKKDHTGLTASFFALTWWIFKKQYATKYFWKRSNNLTCVKQCFKYPAQHVKAKDCGDFCLFEDASMHPWKISEFSKTKDTKRVRISKCSLHWNSACRRSMTWCP